MYSLLIEPKIIALLALCATVLLLYINSDARYIGIIRNFFDLWVLGDIRYLIANAHLPCFYIQIALLLSNAHLN